MGSSMPSENVDDLTEWICRHCGESWPKGQPCPNCGLCECNSITEIKGQSLALERPKEVEYRKAS